jgi:hypothetical protein
MYRLLASSVLSLGLTCSAGATVLMSADDLSPNGPGFMVSDNQSLGKRFAVDAETTLTSIKGYFASPGGQFHVSVWNMDNNSLPASQLYSAQSTMPTRRYTDPWASWAGLDNLSWTVGPGTYFAVFSAEPTDILQVPTYMPEAGLQSEVVFRNNLGKWSPIISGGSVTKGIGVVIEGDVTAVPEPQSGALYLAAALAMFAAHARLRARRF